MKKTITVYLMIALILGLCKNSMAQSNPSKKIMPTIWEGMAITGYVDHGAFVNFGGPGIKLTHKPVSFLLTMLPTFRLKEDIVVAGAKKNSIVTPSLGAGLTFIYKHLALQLPLYYNPKNASSNGKWNLGAGLGYKF